MLLKSGCLIDLTNSTVKKLPALSNSEAFTFNKKGWNLPYIWDLTLLKKVYNQIFVDGLRNKGELFSGLLPLLKKRSSGTKRLLDEYLNALICFNIIDYEKPLYIPTKENFFDAAFEELTSKDVDALKEIYFSYFRFKEIANWFLHSIYISPTSLDRITNNELVNNSRSIFLTSMNDLKDSQTGKLRRLNDTIFYEAEPVEVNQIEESNDKLMRFLEVFINWGIQLGVLEQIYLTDSLNVRCKTGRISKVRMLYFINEKNNFNLNRFIYENYSSNNKVISLPEITVNVAFQYRCSIKKIHNEIIKQTTNAVGALSLQRTSKIFIDGKESIYPKLGNAFVSHIIVR